MRYSNLQVSRINNNLLQLTITRHRELTILTQTAAELKFEVTVNFNGLNSHPLPISIHMERRTFPNPFVMTSLEFTSIDELPFNYHWGSITSYNTIL